jgi:hypothetical protein
LLRDRQKDRIVPSYLVVFVGGFSVLFVAYAARFPLFGTTLVLSSILVAGGAGIVLLRIALPHEHSLLCLIVFGSILGLTLARLVAIAAILCVGFTAGAWATLVALLAVPLLVFHGSFPGLPQGTSEDYRELRAVLGLTSAVLLLVAGAFLSLGRLTERGYLYVPYFNLDFFQHTALVAEIARGLPPQNPYFAGQPLHYYWMFHVWPAVLSRVSAITARSALTLTMIPQIILFTFALSLLLREYVREMQPRFCALGLALFAYSYIGVLWVARVLFPDLIGKIPTFNTPEYTFLSHSWYRDFLYEPQAVAALSILLLGIYIDRARGNGWGRLIDILAGVILGITVATDAFIGVIAVSWYATTKLCQSARDPILFLEAMVPAALAAGIIGCGIWIGMFPTSGASLKFHIHPIVRLAPFYLIAELGPLAIFGSLGLCVTLVRDFRECRPILLLLLVSLIYGFCLHVSIDPNTVLRKSMKVAALPLTVLAAVAFNELGSQMTRGWWRTATTVAIMLGLITLFTDFLQYAGLLRGRGQPATYVGRDEMEMLSWVRTETPSNSVFQELDEVRPGQRFQDTMFSLIATFGERRTLFGSYHHPYIFWVPKETIARRQTNLIEMFGATEARELRRELTELPLDYLYVDEEKPGPVALVRVLAAQGVLKESKCVNRICVFSIVRQGGVSGGL